MTHDLLAPALLLIGAVLVAMALAERPVKRLPLSPALVYLAIGWLAGALSGAIDSVDPQDHAPLLLVLVEWAVHVSLFAVGLRVPLPVATRAWRVAILLASIGMVATIAITAAFAYWLLALAWPAALLLASMLAPTDPVLASEVRVRSEGDRDTVRLSLSAEGGLNDGTAFPAVMLALGALGLHELGPHGVDWIVHDLLWSIGGGLIVGWLLGRGVGRALGWLLQRNHGVAWDELLFVGVIALGYGTAALLHVSAFLVVFLSGIALFRQHGIEPATLPTALPQRLHAFGQRAERLIEAVMVMAIGAAMNGVQWRWQTLLFAFAFVVVARPLAVALVLRRRARPAAQHPLVAWFGIRGVGSLFYLLYALNAGVDAALARELVSACLLCIAASIVLHGVSATPLMAWYQGRRRL